MFFHLPLPVLASPADFSVSQLVCLPQFEALGCACTPISVREYIKMFKLKELHTVSLGSIKLGQVCIGAKKKTNRSQRQGHQNALVSCARCV